MLEAHILILKPFRLGECCLYSLIEPRAEIHLTRSRHLGHLGEFFLQLGFDGLRAGAQFFKRRYNYSFSIAHKGIEQMLSLDLLMAELFRLLLGFVYRLLPLNGKLFPSHACLLFGYPAIMTLVYKIIINSPFFQVGFVRVNY